MANGAGCRNGAFQLSSNRRWHLNDDPGREIPSEEILLMDHCMPEGPRVYEFVSIMLFNIPYAVRDFCIGLKSCAELR